MKKFAWLGSALIYCVLLVSGAAQAQSSEGSPFDGMSAIDIAVAAALRKRAQEPDAQLSQLETPVATTPPVSFFQCDLVELKGRFMHEGWYPIPGNPLPGTASAQASLLGPWQTAEFRLVSLNEDFLQAIELSLDDEASDGMTFLGSFEVPGEAFKMAVSGVVDDGTPYDATCARVFRPQNIEVRFDALFTLGTPGLMPLGLSITNHGPIGIFELKVEEDMGVGASIDSGRVQINQNATVTTTVHLNVPNISVGVLDITVTVTATNENNIEQSNFGTTLARVQRFNLIHQSGFEPPQPADEGSP